VRSFGVGKSVRAVCSKVDVGEAVKESHTKCPLVADSCRSANVILPICATEMLAPSGPA
jgi:hypothetical protein